MAGAPNADQISLVLGLLPSAEDGPEVWDANKVRERWSGVAGTVRAYWYERVTETAGYLDIPDPAGALNITQIHQHARDMLDYWDRFIASFGRDASPEQCQSPTTVGKIKRRYTTHDAVNDAERDFAAPPLRPYGGGVRDRALYPSDGPTEFSFGPGLVAPGKERATPADGGMYRGTTPRRGRPTARDYDAPGSPGVQVRP